MVEKSDVKVLKKIYNRQKASLYIHINYPNNPHFNIF